MLDEEDEYSEEEKEDPEDANLTEEERLWKRQLRQVNKHVKPPELNELLTMMLEIM